MRVALAFLLVWSLTPACNLLPCVERRHDSGLLIVCDDRVGDMPEALKAAGSFAWELADQHPDVFGYPWADPTAGAVELRVTGAAAEPFIQEWLDGTARRGPPEKSLPLPAPAVPLRRVATDRTVRALTAIKDGLVPVKDLPDGELIWADGPDLRRNVIAITIDHESDALLRALAARYGTTSIVIRIERRMPSGY